jgi:dihydrodipicolinate synthase/N-acetylneuraminate lyase
MNVTNILKRVQPGRKIEGISAVLLPFDANGRIDFASFSENVKRTFDAGLAPAINMDTGYTNLLSGEERKEVLSAAREVAQGKRFVAGAFVEGMSGDLLKLYQTEIAEITRAGGAPILFQCSQFKKMSRPELIQFHKNLAASCATLLCFELGEMFAPFGQIYDLETVRALMEIPQITGMKHSSLNRELEWQRLALRDEVRPDFKVYTGNDLAIDMVMYGSDYLLGLSAFAPEAFAARDALWALGDPRFYELNDLLQYLGCFAFRPPVPAYKHSAAQFLKLRGRIRSDTPHPKAQRRPESDMEILQRISERLDVLVGGLR